MGKRARAERRAIDESTAVAQEPAHQAQRRDAVGSDVDAELFAFFSGGYAGELGLRSATGAQLDRLAFSMGPSLGRTPDGYNDAVRFGVNGAHGRLEVGRVARALGALCGPVPLLTVADDATPAERQRIEDKNRRLAEAWPHYFDALRGHYRLRPHGAFEGLHKFDPHAGVVLALPEVAAMARDWCAAQRARDLQANAIAVAKSRREREDRLGLRQGQLRMTLATPVQGSRLRAHHLKRQIEAAGRPSAHPDTEAAIRARWAAPTEEHAMAMLKALVKRTNASKDTPERAEALAAVERLLERAAGLWEAARAAYQVERRRADRQIGAEARATRRGAAELDRLAAQLGERGKVDGEAD